MHIGVTGVGMLTALGQGASATLEGWLAGRSGVRPNERWPAGDFPQPDAAVVEGFRARKVLPDRKAIKLMSRETQLAVAAALEACGGPEAPARLGIEPSRFGAWSSAGYEVTPLADVLEMMGLSRDPDDPSRVSIARLFDEGREAYNPLHPLKTLPNMPLSHASIALGIQGPYGAMGSSPATGIAALIEAADSLARGECDAALALGSDDLVDVFRTTWLGEAGALEHLVPGEAAAALLLRRPGDVPPRAELFAGSVGQEPVIDDEPSRSYGRIATPEARRSLYGDVLGRAALGGAPEPRLCLGDLWGLPERDALEREALDGLLRKSCDLISTRQRLGYVGGAAGLVDVALAVLLVERGDVESVLVTASGLAGDIGAVVVGRPE